MASSGNDHAVREQSRLPVLRCRARATVSLRPIYLLCLSTLVHSLLAHRSIWVAPTWSRLPTHMPWHRPRVLRSHKQGGPLLHHMPLTHAPCVPCALRRLRSAPVPAALWVRLVQSMAVVGDGRIPGLGWTLQRHGDLVTAPLNSLGGPRRNAAKIHASAYPSPFSTTITAI